MGKKSQGRGGRVATARLRPLVYKDTASVETTGGGLAFGWRSGLWFLPEWEPLTASEHPE